MAASLLHQPIREGNFASEPTRGGIFFFFFVCKVRANYNFLTPEKLCSPHVSYYFNEDTRLNTREENRSIHNRHPAKGISIVAYKYCPNGKELLQAACN